MAPLAAPAASSVGRTGSRGAPTNSFFTANLATTPMRWNPATALEQMRSYHQYIRMHKSHQRSIILFLFVLIFYSHCTLRNGYTDAVWSIGSDGNIGKNVGAAAAAAVIGGTTPGLSGAGVGGGSDGDAAAVMAAAKQSVPLTSSEDASRRRSQRRYPWWMRVLTGHGATKGRMELWEVEWWPPSQLVPLHTTTAMTDSSRPQGLYVCMPDTASLSIARTQPPWSAGVHRGLGGLVARVARWITWPVMRRAPPPYTLALAAFFQTRQWMAGGATCRRCLTRAAAQEVRHERRLFSAFIREHKLRVPLLLYYNRLPVYAMMQHLRLMQVRHGQLLDFVSRPYAAQLRSETVEGGVGDNPDLHARELDFEISRIEFVFYLQRLQLRAMRHADAMRLETLHFLRYVSSAIPALRRVWVGQDYCTWPGVVCEVAHVPLNSLVDDEHPSVVAFAENLFSLCRGPQCRQRRCVMPLCSAYTRHLTRHLFTAAAPAYWLKWDRTDDTTAMDEMVWSRGDVATPSKGSEMFNASSYTTAAASVVSRLARSEAVGTRTIWSEHQFAYEHPDLVLAEPALIVDVDVEQLVDDVLASAVPGLTRGNGHSRASSGTGQAYPENGERPYVEDLFHMQRLLLQVKAESAPRGLRYGKQRRDGSTVSIPFTFVSLNLANMGLKGYLPNFYDLASAYNTSDRGEGERKGHRGTADVYAAATPLLTPRSDLYWGRLSRLHMLEARNLSAAATRRTLTSTQAVASHLQRVLRRVERVGLRHRHEDLAAYFSDVTTIARFQNEHWSPYRWSETMAAITANAASSALKKLYSIMEANAFAAVQEPGNKIECHSDVFGELNPRLIALLSVDVSGNPLLTHLFPRTWLSIPYMHTVRTTGTSILAPPLKMRARQFDFSGHCAAESARMQQIDMAWEREQRQRASREVPPLPADAARANRVDAAAASSDSSSAASTTMGGGGSGDDTAPITLDDKFCVGATIIPPFFRIEDFLSG